MLFGLREFPTPPVLGKWCISDNVIWPSAQCKPQSPPRFLNGRDWIPFSWLKNRFCLLSPSFLRRRMGPLGVTQLTSAILASEKLVPPNSMTTISYNSPSLPCFSLGACLWWCGQTEGRQGDYIFLSMEAQTAPRLTEDLIQSRYRTGRAHMAESSFGPWSWLWILCMWHRSSTTAQKG